MPEHELVIRTPRSVTPDGETGVCVGVRDGRIDGDSPRGRFLTREDITS